MMELEGMSMERKSFFRKDTGTHSIWVGLIAPAVIFLAHLVVSYALVPWVCAHGPEADMALHLSTAIAFLLGLGAGALAWRNWRRAGRGWPDDEGGVIPRSRFLALLGLLTSIMLLATIVAQGIPVFILSACQK